MELVSSSGDSVSLTIDGYQYPENRGSGEGDWDANWLMIVGRVRRGTNEWTFRDPCLTTWDARQLSGWLHSVADGSRRPAPVNDDGEGDDVLVFTEPCISFVFQAGKPEGDVVLRIYLWLEALPEPANGQEGPGYFEYYVELVLGRHEVLAVAETWDAELRQYPVRV